MANNARYQRVPDMNRVSMESENAELDASVLLLDPMRGSTASIPQNPPKKSYDFSCHPTFLFRLMAVCVFIPSFILFVISHRERPRVLSALILVCFSMVRNLILIIHYLLSTTLRIRFSIELRSRGPRPASSKRKWPEWLKQGAVHVLLDVVLVTLLLTCTIVANSGAYNYGWYNRSGNFAVPACVLSYIGFAFYLFAIIDLGNPANITTSGGVCFDYGKKEEGDGPDHPPQVYRDVEAAGGLGNESRKTGADSPVII